MSTLNKFSVKSEQLQGFFEYDALELGGTSGFVQRKSKMTATCFAKTLILGWLNNPQASLSELVQVSADLGVEISEVGLHDRINVAAVRFLASLVERSLCNLRERAVFPARLLDQFTQVNIVDSSIFCLPDFLEEYFRGTKVQGGVSTLKVQLSFDYLTGQINAIELQAGRSSDQKCTLPTQFALPGSLTLVDLGYFDQKVFRDIGGGDAFFVSRLQTQTGLYWNRNDEQSLDLLALLKEQTQVCGEFELYLGAKARLKTRFVFAKMPPEVVEDRRRQAKAAARRRGKTCSQRQLDILSWTLFITNVPIEDLSTEQVILIYRVRWQIELVFKLWKSQAKMKHIGTWRVERVLCQFYARLLGVIIFQWIASEYRFPKNGELSIPKAFSIVQRYAVRLLDAIATNWYEVAIIMHKIVQDFQRFAKKCKRRKSLSTYQLLVQSGTGA